MEIGTCSVNVDSVLKGCHKLTLKSYRIHKKNFHPHAKEGEMEADWVPSEDENDDLTWRKTQKSLIIQRKQDRGQIYVRRKCRFCPQALSKAYTLKTYQIHKKNVHPNAESNRKRRKDKEPGGKEKGESRNDRFDLDLAMMTMMTTTKKTMTITMKKTTIMVTINVKIMTVMVTFFPRRPIGRRKSELEGEMRQ